MDSSVEQEERSSFWSLVAAPLTLVSHGISALTSSFADLAKTSADEVPWLSNESSTSSAQFMGWVRVAFEYRPEENAFDNIHTKQQRKKARKRNHQAVASLEDNTNYFAKLYEGTLELYEREAKRTLPVARLSLQDYAVSILPSDLPVGDMYNKRFPICLRHITESRKLYMYFASAIAKEEWYIALWVSSGRRPKNSVPTAGQKQYMAALLGSLELEHVAQKVTAKPLPPIAKGDKSTQWINALFGRMFLSNRDSSLLKYWFEQRISKRIQTMRRPAMLGPLSIQRFELGDHIPLLYNAKLLRVTPTGEVEICFDVTYAGGLSIDLETTVYLQTGIAQLEIPFVLGINVNHLVGKMLVRMPPLPSDRIWFGFYDPGPTLSLTVRPLVSETSVDFGVIGRAIQRRILDTIKENLVLPQMESIIVPGIEKPVFDMEQTAEKSDTSFGTSNHPGLSVLVDPKILGSKHKFSKRGNSSSTLGSSSSSRNRRHKSQQPSVASAPTGSLNDSKQQRSFAMSRFRKVFSRGGTSVEDQLEKAEIQQYANNARSFIRDHAEESCSDSTSEERDRLMMLLDE